MHYSGYKFVTINGKHIQEHRIVMEQRLGRPLTRSENVHHINGDRADNRLENLELWEKAQPCGQRVADKIREALRVIEKYGREPEAFEWFDC